MTTNAYLISWDETGLDEVVPITEYEQVEKDNVFRILKNEPTVRNPLDSIMQNMILRARFNLQRHYEIYSIECVKGVGQADIWQMFENDPQAAADLIRERGVKILSDRVQPGDRVIA